MTQALTTTTEPVNDGQFVTYDVTVEQIAKMGEQYLTLHADTRDGEAECRKARQIVVSTRTGVDKRRKAMGEEARAYLERVNSTAKTLIAALAPIESHLDTEIKAVEAERERIKNEKAAAAQKEIDDRIAAAQAEAAENARIAREAEEKRLAEEAARLKAEREDFEAEQRAAREKAEAEERERKRVAAEAQALVDAENERKQAELDRQRAELEAAQAAEQAKLDEQRRQVEAEATRVEAARIAQERAEAERVAAAQAEAERLAREEQERLAAEQRKAELEAARPDAEKLVAYADAIDAIPVPEMSTDSGRDELYEVRAKIGAADALARAFLARSKGETF
jgi:DNA repair exonuclease SbcCD ATPase subunit